MKNMKVYGNFTQTACQDNQLFASIGMSKLKQTSVMTGSNIMQPLRERERELCVPLQWLSVENI